MAPSARFTEDFAYEVLSVVGEIPEGTVATYGQIARLIGRDKNSRLVARVLSHASNYGDFPCHGEIVIGGCSERRNSRECNGKEQDRCGGSRF